MTRWGEVIGLFSALLLFPSSAALLLHFFDQTRRRNKLIQWTMILSFALYSAGLLVRGGSAWQLGLEPFSGSFQTMSLLAWILLGMALVMQRRVKLSAMALFLFPLGTVCAWIAYFLPGANSRPALEHATLIFGVHIAAVVAGISCFGLALLAALLFLITQHALKTKRFGRLFESLPSLQTMDLVAVRSLVVGFVALSGGLASGIYLAHQLWPANWLLDSKVILASVTWAWFFAVLGLRGLAGWRGVPFFTALLIGFLFVVATYLGVIFFFPSYGQAPVVTG